ncbi:hypothetical protein [Ohtaekwangia sp.]|uniref:hypothetical protein n=1 Tax=Ohtaekwangia sp. TaxID=2066019 RepID=UPI002FDD40AC
MNFCKQLIFLVILLCVNSTLFAQQLKDGNAADSLRSSAVEKADSTRNKAVALNNKIQNRVDSLKKIGATYSSIHNHRPVNLADTARKVLPADSIKSIEAKAKAQQAKINEVSTELGVGTLGGDVSPVHGINTSLPQNIELPGINQPSINSPDLNIGKPAVSIPEVKNGSEDVSGIGNEIKSVEGISSEVNNYSNEVKSIQENDLKESKELPALAEKEMQELDEMKALQQVKGFTDEEVEAYKKAIEQYKNEKRMEAELAEKAKEVANDAVLQNQSVVDGSMKKIAKYKYKFSSVADMRNLPKHAPNPLKDLPLRERIIPGLSLQVLNSTDRWLEFDPNVNYRLTGNWSAGIGGMFRFSMNPSKLKFSDFGSMYGYKTIVQYKAFKGFFLQAEGHRVTWKPWDTRLKDPYYRENVYVALVGIGKSHAISKRLRGNIQTFYHYAWGIDPYKPKVMLRFGIEFSLAKREKQSWEKRLKELQDCD